MATTMRQAETFDALARDRIGKGATVRLLRDGSRVADGTAILLVHDHPFSCVMLVSQPDYPAAVEEGTERARRFARRIRLTLASAMLLPLAEGRHNGLSYAILPYRNPFSGNRLVWAIQRFLISSAVLDWLAGLAVQSEARNRGADLYLSNLAALGAVDGLRDDIREAAAHAAARVASGELRPRLTPMHGDLWRGNILRSSGDGFPFAVIDWRGSEVDGFPIYDLVRLADSFRLSSRRLDRELNRHAALLGCTRADTEGHLLAGLGHYAAHRGEMDLAHFVNMTHRTYDRYRHAGG